MAAPPGRPLLIFDGGCNFCRTWIERWRLETGDAVDYQPSQEVADRFPEIPAEDFEKAVYLVRPDGSVFRAAEAVFLALEGVPGKRWPLALYRRSRCFRAVTEAAYATVARHRSFFSLLTRLFIGPSAEPSTFTFSSWLAARALGVAALCAVLSLWVQVDGLFGSGGIAPAGELLERLELYFENNQENLAGASARTELPCVFWWWGTSDAALHLALGTAAAAAGCLALGVLPGPACLVVWVFYFSFFKVGTYPGWSPFLGFQWDILLLETLALATLFVPWGRLWDGPSRHPEPPRLARWLFWVLLFKLMFESGLVKFTNYAFDGSNTWRDFTALDYHYFTQPIPWAASYTFHHLPAWVQSFSLAVTYAIELVLPFFIFGPRRLRRLAAAGTALLMVMIILSGNYGFFNLLALVLCIPLIDDQALPARLRRRLGDPRAPLRRRPIWAARVRLVLLVPYAALGVWVFASHLPVAFAGNKAAVAAARGEEDAPEEKDGAGGKGQGEAEPGAFTRARRSLEATARRYALFANYGLFRVMTTTRPEIIIYGSDDGREWRPYEFKWKPGDPARPPGFCFPHMPRLDWQMWFAALQLEHSGRQAALYIDQHPGLRGWFRRFLSALLQGRPEILDLMAENPFPQAPPRYYRIHLYHYRFADPETRRRTGAWWVRERIPEIEVRGELRR